MHGVGYNYEDVEDDDDVGIDNDDDDDDGDEVGDGDDDDDDDNGVGDDDVCMQELLPLLTGLLVSPGLADHQIVFLNSFYMQISSSLLFLKLSMVDLSNG